jgi:hypothetical protein
MSKKVVKVQAQYHTRSFLKRFRISCDQLDL